MKKQFLFGILLTGLSASSLAVDLLGITDSNGVISIRIDPAIMGDEYTAASVATNLAASYPVRLAAIQTLANNPAPHHETLIEAACDTSLGIRLAAAEALASSDSTAAAAVAKNIIQQLSTAAPALQSDNMFGLQAAALLARLNDSSGFSFVASRLAHAKFAAEKNSALSYLPDFRRFPEVPAADVIMDFIVGSLPALEEEGTAAYKEADILVPKAFLALYRLQAVSKLPQLKAWEPNLPTRHQQNLHYYIRGLEALQERDTNP